MKLGGRAGWYITKSERMKLAGMYITKSGGLLILYEARWQDRMKLAIDTQHITAIRLLYGVQGPIMCSVGLKCWVASQLNMSVMWCVGDP